jgi:hypothetical protein
MAQPSLIIDYKDENIEIVHDKLHDIPIEKDPKEAQDIEDSLLASVLHESIIDQWQKDIQNYHLSTCQRRDVPRNVSKQEK